VTALTPERIDGIAYREARPDGWDGDGPVALAIHGYPTSSYLWRNVLARLADTGIRAVAPDLPGFGDSPADLPGTWERQMEHLERFRNAVGIEQTALLVHDWGGLIGLRWACDHPGVVTSLVITDTGFFPDGHWHGMAKSLKTEGEGEQIVENMSRDLFAMAIRQVSPAMADETIDEFYKTFSDPERRRSQLDLYRSGEFSKLEAYDGKLAALGVPALILWGGKDEFAPVGGGHRFEKQIPDSRLIVLEEAGHFLMEDEPERVADEVATFLAGVTASMGAR
jgi:haloalkane dehalogenase